MNAAKDRLALLKACTAQFQKVIQGDNFSKAIIDEAALEILQICDQNLTGDMIPKLSELFTKFVNHLMDEFWTAQKDWHLPKTELFLFPDNCKFVFSKNQSTVVVVELPPQTRTITIDSDICGENPEEENGLTGTERHCLAFPYSIFIMHFVGGFSSLYLGWRKSPLQNMDSLIYPPLLPNVHTNLSICMGGADLVDSRDLGIHGAAQALMSTFWTSTFTGDLPWFWNHKGKISEETKSAYTWAEATRRNPLFILNLPLEESVNITDGGVEAKSLNTIVNTIIGSNELNATDGLNYKTKLQQIADNATAGMAMELESLIRCVDHRSLESRAIMKLNAASQKMLRGVAAGLNVLAAEQKSFVLQNSERVTKPQGSGKFWSEYES